MTALLKNPRQEEFSALMHTMEELGFRAADVARLLNKTHGAISQYLSGKTNPSETVLDLFRRIVEEKKGGQGPVEIGEEAVKEQLSDLRRFSPADYEVAKTTISMLHKRLPPAINSKATAAAGRMLKKAAASVLKHGPK
jgi:transcriptional regulator with XRE-family HTH domain